MINPKNFARVNDPILTKIAQKIPEKKIKSKETRQAIKKMFKIALGEQTDKKKPVLVGLASPQIGISQRIILVDVSSNGKGGVGDLRVFINPEIVWRSKDESEWYEGCFSTGNVCGIVSRYTKVKIKAFNENGESKTEEYTGYVARIFQHEIDHLNGKVFPERVKDDEKLHWVEDNEFTKYREVAWKKWPKKCSRQIWELFKT